MVNSGIITTDNPNFLSMMTLHFTILNRLQKSFFVLYFFVAFLPHGHAQNQIDPPAISQKCEVVEIFSEAGCPHCANAYRFLNQLQSEYPQISVIKRDVFEDNDNLKRFIELSEAFNIERPGVPSFYICGEFLVGFDSHSTAELIIQLLGLSSNQAMPTATPSDGEVNLPWIGKINVQQYGLLAFTIIIGLIDGFNPCAMWVLLFLLSLLVNLQNRKRILMVAGTFVLVSGAVYFAFMAAWLNIFLIIGFSRTLQIIVAAIAIIIGAVHIKDFFAWKRGITLSIPESSKSRLYARIRQVIHAENILVALLGVIVVAILVNFLELLCTAGLPALYTQILSSQTLSLFQYYYYLVIYNLAYIFDDALMVSIVIYTLHRYKIQELQGRWLKLFSGSMILLLGGLLLFAPNWLI